MKGLIFTYVMTYGGAVVALFNPFVGLLVYIVFAVAKPELLWGHSVDAGNYSRIVAIATLIGWTFRGFGQWNLGRGWAIVLSFVVFYVGAVVSAVFATNEELAWDFVGSISKILLPFLVGVSVITSNRELKLLVWVMVLSVGYVALRENEKYFLGMFRESDNMLCHQMSLMAGPAFLLGLKTHGFWGKALAFCASGLMVHTVLFHMSRGAMLGLVVAGTLTFWLLPKRGINITIFVLAVLVGLRLAGPQVWHRFESSFATKEVRDESAQSRLDLWANMLEEFKKSPVVGIGPNHWPLVAHHYGWPPGKEGHGMWVQLTAELGAPAIAGLAAFYLLCIFRLWPIARGKVPMVEGSLTVIAQMVVVSISCFIVEAQFGSFEALESPYYMAMIGVCALKLVNSSASSPQDVRSPISNRPQFQRIGIAGRYPVGRPIVGTTA